MADPNLHYRDIVIALVYYTKPKPKWKPKCAPSWLQVTFMQAGSGPAGFQTISVAMEFVDGDDDDKLGPTHFTRAVLGIHALTILMD